MRELLSWVVAIILFPMQLVGGFLLAFGTLAAAGLSITFFVAPFDMAFSVWAKAIIVAVLGLLILWTRGRLVSWVAG